MNQVKLSIRIGDNKGYTAGSFALVVSEDEVNNLISVLNGAGIEVKAYEAEMIKDDAHSDKASVLSMACNTAMSFIVAGREFDKLQELEYALPLNYGDEEMTMQQLTEDAIRADQSL